MPLWIKKKLWIKSLIQEEIGFSGKILFPEHHASHAASAFYASPFKDAAFLTMDGVGGGLQLVTALVMVIKWKF